MSAADGALRADSERTRRRILRSARGLYRELGYEHVRMSDIARDVGCARATVYNHFANREALLEAVCSEYLTGYLEIFGRLDAWASPDRTVFEVLRETVAQELRWRVANGDLRVALDRAKRQRRDFYVEGDRRIDEAMLDWFGAIYEASGRRGLVRDDVALSFATGAIYAMIDHVVAGFPVDTSTQDVELAADRVARLQWHALYRDEPEHAPPFTALALPRHRAADPDP